jgi:hypothetical protein
MFIRTASFPVNTAYDTLYQESRRSSMKNKEATGGNGVNNDFNAIHV